MVITDNDVQIVDDLMERLSNKLQLLGVDTSKFESVCYEILYDLEEKVEKS